VTDPRLREAGPPKREAEIRQRLKRVVEGSHLEPMTYAADLAWLLTALDRQRATHQMREAPSEAPTLEAMRECFRMIEAFAKWGRNLPDSGDITKAREELKRIGYTGVRE
jgi:hypothetical protein